MMWIACLKILITKKVLRNIKEYTMKFSILRIYLQNEQYSSPFKKIVLMPYSPFLVPIISK